MIAADQLDRAEKVTRSITDANWLVWTTFSESLARALTVLVEALAAASQLDHAEKVARSIPNPKSQAQALTKLANVAEPATARSLIAEALAVGRWTIPLWALADVDPTALSAFVDECEPHRPRRPAVNAEQFRADGDRELSD